MWFADNEHDECFGCLKKLQRKKEHLDACFSPSVHCGAVLWASAICPVIFAESKFTEVRW